MVLNAENIQRILLGLTLLGGSFIPNLFGKEADNEGKLSKRQKEILRFLIRFGGIGLLILGLS